MDKKKESYWKKHRGVYVLKKGEKYKHEDKKKTDDVFDSHSIENSFHFGWLLE